MTTEVITKKDRRESKGRVIALSRRVYRIINSDAFYVESESKDNVYYYVMFDTVKNFEWCSCADHSNRHMKCKHLHAVEYTIKFNVVVDTDKLPREAKKDNSCNVDILPYTEDEYDF